jgi:hypothetical protein
MKNEKRNKFRITNSTTFCVHFFGFESLQLFHFFKNFAFENSKDRWEGGGQLHQGFILDTGDDLQQVSE